jgi:nucleoside-diphosphate-sugar epimerase
MRVVLLGGAGYIGSVAAHRLARLGHSVTVVDGMIYNRGDDPARLLPAAAVFVAGDLRDPGLLARVSAGADAVVHLGGLVGEPACQVSERLAVELNYAAPVLAAEAAARAGAARFVFFSSCSVYGRGQGTVDEDTAARPLGIYARTKVLAECRLPGALDGVPLTVLRLATVHGRSPRQRLDSVVNSMASRAVATGRIPLRGGAQRRPLVHVGDVARVLARALAGAGQQVVWNVGSDRENHTIRQIAETVAAVVPGSRIEHGAEQDETDARDYRVSFARLREALPGACWTTLRNGAREVAGALAAGELGDPGQPEYDNHQGLVRALSTGHVRVLGTSRCEELTREYEAARESR